PPVRVRQRAVSLARLPDRRQPAVARLRSVLRLARRLPDVVLFSAVGPVRLAEPVAQGCAQLSGRPRPTARGTVCRGRIAADAGGALPGLSADRDGSRHRRLLAALAGAPVLAERTDVVFVAAVRRGCRGG